MYLGRINRITWQRWIPSSPLSLVTTTVPYSNVVAGRRSHGKQWKIGGARNVAFCRIFNQEFLFTTEKISAMGSRDGNIPVFFTGDTELYSFILLTARECLSDILLAEMCMCVELLA